MKRIYWKENIPPSLLAWRALELSCARNHTIIQTVRLIKCQYAMQTDEGPSEASQGGLGVSPQEHSIYHPPCSVGELSGAFFGQVRRTCWWVIGLPGGSSPRPPFSRFARRPVVGRRPSLLCSCSCSWFIWCFLDRSGGLFPQTARLARSSH
jgi:hypothetical protein